MTKAGGESGRTGIARRLSKLGFCSRARAHELVQSGRVAVNGTTRRDPEFPVRPSDRVAVDGQEIDRAELVYLVMNKPRGLVTTASDEKGRPTVYSLLAKDLPFVSPVGRLDQASEGLLLFTNDTVWANAIASPGSHLAKVYRVQIAAVASERRLDILREGIEDRGETLRVVRASILRKGTKNSWLEVVLDEGRNRHIRRMLRALGIEVMRLIRVAIGPLELGSLPKGSVRPLELSEKRALDAAITGATASSPAARKSSSRRA